MTTLPALPETIPAGTSWYLADLSEAGDKEELFTKQAPQRLKALREHVLIESAVSSKRIEGVQVDQSHVHTLILGRAPVRDRNEEEVRGYRNALKLIHEKNARLPISEETILALHRLARGDILDAGKYKEKESDIIERYPDGRQRIRFKTVAAVETSKAMSQTPRQALRELVHSWVQCLEERWVHRLIEFEA